MKNLVFLLMSLQLLLVVPSVFAHYNYSGNNCNDRRVGQVTSKCRGRPMPADRIRNFHFDSHGLECTTNFDPFYRLPQDYNFDEWQTWAQTNAEKAQEYRLQQPLIKWTGKIPYQTVEVWSWEKCEEDSSSFECGSHEHERTWTTRECDSEQNNCRNVEHTETYSEANYCHYDHRKSEQVHCSAEKMDYEAEFLRDPNWKPGASVANETMPGKIQTYHNALPLKYDLMAGESELVQVFNSGSRAFTMNPKVVIGDAWNHYTPLIKTNPAVLSCQHDTRYSMSIGVRTDYRIANKASPNAFKLPVSFRGEKMSPFKWKNGQVNTKPKAVVLMDSSAAMTELIAQQSRENAERQVVKIENGQGMNSDGLSEKQQIKKDGFFKNTLVRVQLVKVNRFSWLNTEAGFDLISDDVKNLIPSDNYLSEREEIRLSDKWEVPLDEVYNRVGKKFGQFMWSPDSIFNGDTVHLRPGRVYMMKVSMYQKGVPFYLQSCEEDPKPNWRCNRVVRLTPLGRDEDDYFSRPLEIEFHTSDKFDERNIWQEILEGTGTVLGEWLVYKRPPR